MADYFTAANVPATSAALSSSVIKGEFASLATGFTKVADYTGNGGKILAINSGGTAQEALTTTGTGSGVRATSPTLVTPVLGVATVTTINKITFTQPATGATVTIVDGKVLTVSNTLTLTATDGSTLAIGTGGTLGTAAYTSSGDYATVAQVHYVGTTSIAANRGSAAQALTGITSIDGSAASATTAATLTTPRAIYGNNFDGSADLTQIIASTYGGTGNGFAKFSGPTSSEKTFTLPDASATVVTEDASSPGIVRGKNKEIFKTASADSPLTAAQCAGTVVSNYGMTAANCTIDLPTAEEGLSFVCILPTVRAFFFKLHCPAAQADKIYLLGVAGSDDGNVGVASGYATGAACSFFTFKESDGGYAWFAIPIFGTWTAS